MSLKTMLSTLLADLKSLISKNEDLILAGLDLIPPTVAGTIIKEAADAVVEDVAQSEPAVTAVAAAPEKRSAQ